MANVAPKKDTILGIFNENPFLEADVIAKMAKSSVRYVQDVIKGLDVPRYQKQYQHFHQQRQKQNLFWKNEVGQFKDFINNFLPKITKVPDHISQPVSDFANTFLPTDDIYAASGTGTDDYASLVHFEWLAERRVGVAWRLTKKPAEDAMRNRFRIVDFMGEIIEREDIMEWCEKTDFYNQLAQALYYERVYGAAFLIKYYTENDGENQKMEEQAPDKAPVAFQAFPPTQMSPVEVSRTSYLDTDPQTWDVQGGQYNSARIHHSRVHVFMTRRVAHRWRGLSVFEPIWIAIMSYFQALIYLQKAFAKLGTVIPYWLVEATDDIDAIYDIKADLLDDMKMNSLYIGKVGEEFGFAPTQLSSGLVEMMEIWKEDIAAGCSFPLPIIFGRAQASGMGSQMYLVFERYYWNEIANIQASISDDVLQIFKDAGFKDLDRKRIDWQLAIQKTDQQRLVDEGMQIENEILKEQYVQMQIQTMMLLDQAQNPQVDENPKDNSNKTPGNGGVRKNNLGSNGGANSGEKNKESEHECIQKYLRQGKTKAQAESLCKRKKKNDFIEENNQILASIRQRRQDFINRYMKDTKREYGGLES